MKVKIQAGAEFDTATPAEIRKELDSVRTSWMAEVAKGDHFVRFSAFGDVAGGALLIGDKEDIGPQPGFVWSIKRIAVSSPFAEATDTLDLFQGAASNSSLIVPKLGRFTTFTSNSLVLYPGDGLVFSGAVAGPGRVWVTGQAREVPMSLAWRL